MKRVMAGLVGALVIAIGGCGEEATVPSDPAGSSEADFGHLKKKDLVALGEILFFEETFGGNGRTCGTCHPAPTFEISPEEIAALPDDDVFFAGALDITSVEEVKNRGLIQYPLGGTLLDPDVEVLRAIPATVNLKNTAPFTSDGRAVTLQEQALEAVLLHALDGEADLAGERLPTDEELDALAAFQESLRLPSGGKGRRIQNNPLVEQGLEVFNGKAQCVVCHNGNEFTDNRFHNSVGCVLLGGSLRGRCGGPDEDHGRCRTHPTADDCDAGPAFTSFNTPQLRGVSETAPYFHNNVSPSLTTVVRFYNGPLFSESPAAIRLGIPPLGLTDEEVAAVVAFLETL